MESYTVVPASWGRNQRLDREMGPRVDMRLDLGVFFQVHA
jgi:hypothetical protein